MYSLLIEVPLCIIFVGYFGYCTFSPFPHFFFFFFFLNFKKKSDSPPSHPLSVPLVPGGDVSPVTNKLMWKSNKRAFGLSGFLSPQAKETLIKELRGASGHIVHSASRQAQPAAAFSDTKGRENYQVLGTAEEFG